MIRIGVDGRALENHNVLGHEQNAQRVWVKIIRISKKEKANENT